ncbi:MAG TPA: alpha/beta hydrolase [Ramlibacter sp.]|nr:alpha/beta hydrolase [Ramlibacter sp.]
MAIARTDDGCDLYYEETGAGVPIVFVHEFAGDCRSWEPQVRHFSRRYRCITFNARGYPPSSVPPEVASYSQERAVADVIAVLDACGIAKAHIVGLSMGGFAALHLGLRHPDRAHSLVVAGAGYGAEPEKQAVFRREAEISAAMLLEQGMAAFAAKYLSGPTRQPFQRNDPRGFAQLQARMAEHSALGSANTQLGVQRMRPSLYAMTEALSRLTVPTLVLNGDEDTPCLAPGLLLKATVPAAALAVLPDCGHTINLEAPADFNRLVGEFLAQVDSGRWPVRQRPASSGSVTGMLDAGR